MQKKSIPPTPDPVVAYPALVGKLLAQRRDQLGLTQSALAEAVGLSQPAYSRLEKGESVLNIAQLRSVCAHLNIGPGEVLGQADQFATLLERRGIEVVSEKPDNAAAIAIGLGLLAAILLGSK